MKLKVNADKFSDIDKLVEQAKVIAIRYGMKKIVFQTGEDYEKNGTVYLIFE